MRQVLRMTRPRWSQKVTGETSGPLRSLLVRRRVRVGAVLEVRPSRVLNG